MGYAVLETLEKDDGEDVKSKPPKVLGHGSLGFGQGEDEKYQQHRLNLIEFWVERSKALFHSYKPDEVINEILPPVGFPNSVNVQLGLACITTVQAMALQAQIPIVQIAANTVKKTIGKTGKATKVKVRNGVYEILPELKIHHKEWTKVFDVSDAFAIGLTRLAVLDG